jgi:hypothetical protein
MQLVDVYSQPEYMSLMRYQERVSRSIDLFILYSAGQHILSKQKKKAKQGNDYAGIHE